MTPRVRVLAEETSRWLPSSPENEVAAADAELAEGAQVLVWLPPPSVLLAQRWYDQDAGRTPWRTWLDRIATTDPDPADAGPVRAVEHWVAVAGPERVTVVSGPASAVAGVVYDDAALGAGSATPPPVAERLRAPEETGAPDPAEAPLGIALVEELAAAAAELDPRDPAALAALSGWAAAEALGTLAAVPPGPAGQWTERWWAGVRDRIVAAGVTLNEWPGEQPDERSGEQLSDQPGDRRSGPAEGRRSVPGVGRDASTPPGTEELTAVMAVALLRRTAETPAPEARGEEHSDPLAGRSTRAIGRELLRRARRRLSTVRGR